jgi:aspartate/methionine/tyrosine aminotransferase
MQGAVMNREFRKDVIDETLRHAGIDFNKLDIQELWKQIGELEKKLGVEYVRMDFGVPGLPPPHAAIYAQLQAISNELSVMTYPPAGGTTELKGAASAFIQNFLNLDVEAEYCFPTCGATQAAFIAQAIAGRRDGARAKVLHLEPGYPPIKEQTRFLGLGSCGIDLFACRGTRLVKQVHQYCQDGEIAAIAWSSPNNPTAAILSEEELQGIAELCDQNDVIAIEDAAYLCMSPNSSPPRVRSVAHFTDNFFLLLSASKMLSYAGERLGLLVTSRSLAARNYEFLRGFFGCANVGQAITRAIFNLTAGAPHSAQLGVAAAFNAASRGEYDLVGTLAEYGRRARALKDIFVGNGFSLLYTNGQDPGFYLTFAYPGYNAPNLLKELLYYGITALPLRLFGSSQSDGVRACVGLLGPKEIRRLEQRVRSFSRAHGQAVTPGLLTLEPNRKEQP